jgi:peptide deformylase
MLQIRPMNDPILRAHCHAIDDPKDLDIRILAQEMAETMQIAGGLGLAAPQVGYELRLITMVDAGRALALINPEIIDRSVGMTNREEGCLSLPGVYFPVSRHAWVDVKYTGLDGEEHVQRFEGVSSVCAQHEIDHLDGIRAIDRLSPMKRAMVLKQFEKRKAIRQRAR